MKVTKVEPAVFAGVENKAKVTLDYFSKARITMLIEINCHPILVAELLRLHEEDNFSWEEQMAEIAAYCNVTMDGLYSNEDLEILYPQLTKRMADTRLGNSSGVLLV